MWAGLFVIILRLAMTGRLGRTNVPMFLVFILGLGGLILIVLTLSGLISLFNPRVALKLSRAAIPPGGSAELQWTCDGRHDRIQRLAFRLEGWEKVVYGSGSESTNQDRLFSTIPLHATEHADKMASGKCTLHVPQGAMPTFRGMHNKIRWIIVAHGQMRRGPDIKNGYELNVVPPPADPAASIAAPVISHPYSADVRTLLRFGPSAVERISCRVSSLAAQCPGRCTRSRRKSR